MRERHMVVGDVIEKVDFFFFKHEGGGNGVHRRITPALVKEATCTVEVVEVVDIGVRSEPVQISNFEIGPLQRTLAYVNEY